MLGLFTGLLTLPLAPVRSVAWLAEQLEKYAEQEQRDPERIRRDMRAADDAFAAGAISEREWAETQDSLIALLIQDGHDHGGR